MSILRAAAQQALAAMEEWNPSLWTTADEAAITALRAALAQQEQDTATDRVAFERHAESLGYSVDPDTRAGREGGYWSSHTHLMWETWQAALAQQEQAEPMAWIQPDHLQKARQAPFLCRVEPTQRMSDFVAIFTHPPRREWRGLTDEEIQTIVNKVATGTYQTSDTFARAIEAALRSKNYG